MKTLQINKDGLNKRQMLKLYNEKITEAAKELINKHICWSEYKGFCRQCGKKIVREYE